MPYNNLTIYKIQHITNKSLIYIGHTTNFKSRLSAHKYLWKIKTNELYEMIRQNGGFSNFHMSIIKEFSCKKIIELDLEKSNIYHTEEMKAYITNLDPEKLT
jgi:predicted GIY-YIG superfamily endonuclease